jgi:hypothetical protein
MPRRARTTGHRRKNYIRGLLNALNRPMPAVCSWAARSPQAPTPSPLGARQPIANKNGKLKKIVADLSLDKAMLQDMIRRNVWSAPPMQGSWI